MMEAMIKVQCPGCGKRFKVAEQYAGQEATCTGCNQPIVIPMPGESPAPEAAQPTATASSELAPQGTTFVSIPGFIALGLGALALLPIDAAAFTYIRMPMAALAFILAAVALVLSIADKRVVPIVPGIAVVIAGAAVAFAVMGNVKHGVARMEAAAENAESQPQVEPEPEPQPVIAEAPPPEPEPEPAPPPAAPAPEVAVSIVSARIGPVEVRNEAQDQTENSERNYLAVTIRIDNHDDAIVSYTTWAGIPGSYSLDVASLEDDRGSFLRRVKLGRWAVPVGRVDVATIEPGESATDLLLFERPIGDPRPMELTLPGANVGRSAAYRIRITPDMIEQ